MSIGTPKKAALYLDPNTEIIVCDLESMSWMGFHVLQTMYVHGLGFRSNNYLTPRETLSRAVIVSLLSKDIQDQSCDSHQAGIGCFKEEFDRRPAQNLPSYLSSH